MKTVPRRVNRRLRAGVTLIEVTISSFFISVITLACVSVLMVAVKNHVLVGAKSVAIEKSQVATFGLEAELGKAIVVILPQDVSPMRTWTASSLGATSLYLSTSGGTTYQTGLYMVYPPTRSLPIYSSSGASMTLSGTSQIYDQTQTLTTKSALIYRADLDGTPNPTSGPALWIKKYTSGSLTESFALSKKIATQWNAVRFVRPYATRVDSLEIQMVTADKASGQSEINSNATNSGSSIDNEQERLVNLYNATSDLKISVTMISSP